MLTSYILQMHESQFPVRNKKTHHSSTLASTLDKKVMITRAPCITLHCRFPLGEREFVEHPPPCHTLLPHVTLPMILLHILQGPDILQWLHTSPSPSPPQNFPGLEWQNPSSSCQPFVSTAIFNGGENGIILSWFIKIL